MAWLTGEKMLVSGGNLNIEVLLLNYFIIQFFLYNLVYYKMGNVVHNGKIQVKIKFNSNFKLSNIFIIS